MSSQQHDLKQRLEVLKGEHQANLQQLSRKDRDIRALREDVFILREELIKLGKDPNLPTQLSGRERRDIPDNSGSDVSQTSMSEHTRRFASGSDWSSVVADDFRNDGERFHRREKTGIFKATPLLVAEGSTTDSKKAIMRTHSLRPVDEGYGYRRDPLLNGPQLKSKLRRMECALEEERKKTEILREKYVVNGSKIMKKVGEAVTR